MISGGLIQTFKNLIVALNYKTALLVVFASLVTIATMAAPYEDAVEKCRNQIVWGYFLNDLETMKKLGGRIDVWGPKDLTGKFKTQEDCEKGRKKLKYQYLSEPCEGFYSQADVKLKILLLDVETEDPTVFDPKMKYSFNFDSEADCLFFMEKGMAKKTSEDKDIHPKGSSKYPRFKDQCQKKEIVLCKKYGQQMSDIMIQSPKPE